MGEFKFLASQVSIEGVEEKIKRIFIQKITITTISNKNFKNKGVTKCWNEYPIFIIYPERLLRD